MKVRDIKQYRQRIIAKTKDDIEHFQLGAKDEPILEKFYAVDASIKDIIEDISSFADNTFEQIFYEFLQNADDAGASKMTVFFDEDKLVVINNGEPFLTDGEETEGQLRSFLRSKDSGKRKEDGKERKKGSAIGKYGLGSKLLYDLIPDINNNEGRMQDQLRKKALLKELKGVYLFSWSDLSQIEMITQGIQSQDLNFVALPEDSKQPLLTKILYSYYPAYINEEKTDLYGNTKNLFSEQEFDNFRNGIEKAFTTENKCNFETGTALFIPIGRGVSIELQKKLVENGIGIALNFLKNVKQVKINNKEISKVKGDKINIPFTAITFDDDDNEIEKDFHSAIFLPDQIDTNNTNFYQYLPIIGEKRKLSFIIHTENLKLLQNRQNIKEDEPHNENMFRKIFEQLDKKLESHFDNDNIFYKKFINTFIQSNEPDFPITKKYFYDDIIERLSQSFPIAENQYASSDKVKIKSTKLNINPADVGLGYYWLDESFEDNYQDFKDKFGLGTWTIFDLLSQNNANKEQIVTWIKNLSDVDYERLIEELKDKNPDFPFIKTSGGQVLSISELPNSQNIIPITPKTVDLIEIFKDQKIEFTDVALLNFSNLLPNNDILLRLNNRILAIKENLNENQKYLIFKTFQDNFSGKEKDLAIFKNRKGEFYKLGKLIKNDTNLAPSGILHDFQIDPTEPYFDEYDAYFLKENEVWKRIRDNWINRIKPFIQADNYSNVIADLGKFFNSRLQEFEYDKNYNRVEAYGQFLPSIDWVLTNENILTTPSATFLNKKLADLNQDEYDLICSFIGQNTDLEIVSKPVFDTIKDIEFGTWNKTSLHGNLNQNSYTIKIDFVETLQKIYPDILTHFVFIEQDGQLYLEKKNNRVPFYSTDNDLIVLLNQHNHVLLPSVIKGLNLSGVEVENDDFVNRLINHQSIGAHKALIKMVMSGNVDTKANYLNRLTRLDIDSNKVYQPNDYEYKVVSLISDAQFAHNIAIYKQKIYIDQTQLSTIQYTDTVTVVDCIGTFSLKDLEGYNGINLNAIKDNFTNLYTSLFDTAEKPINQISINNCTNGEQIAFLHTRNLSQAKVNYPNVTENQILDSFFKHKLKNIQSVFIDFPNWIFVEKEDAHLLLARENVADYLRIWTDNDEKRQWLKENNLRFEKCSSISIRKNYNQNLTWAKSWIDEELGVLQYANKTLEWLSQKNDFNPDFIKNCISLEQRFVIKHQNLPSYLLVKTEQGWRLKVSQELNNQNTVFFTQLSEEILKKFSQRLIDNGVLYLKPIGENADTQFENKIKSKPFYLLEKDEKIDEEKLKNCKEWEVSFYNKWKDFYKNDYIRISDENIPAILRLKYNDIMIDDNSSNECKTVTNENVKTIYVKSDAKSPKSVLNTLEKHLDEAFSGEEEKFVKLQSLFIEELTEKEADGKGDGNVNIPKITDEDKDFIEKYAKKILEHKEAIEAGHFGKGNGTGKGRDEDGDEQEDEIPNCAKISGRIGELAMFFWLQNRSFNIEDHAPRMQPYDLLLQRDNKHFYLEIKTKAGSFNEDGGSIPIFLRQSQKKWIQDDDVQHYFLTTISLKDVGLYEFYKQYRDRILAECEAEMKIALEKLMNDDIYKKIAANEFHMRLTSPNSQDDPFS